MPYALIVLYISTVPVANWFIGHIGTVCIDGGGPCLIPVWPGIMAPSGVMFIGAALLLRDLVQRQLGIAAGLMCIAAGVSVSCIVAPPTIILASAAAFAISELSDFAVYTPLANRGFILALLSSCAVGAAIDSASFLLLAFGNIDHLAGQVIGKLYAVIGYFAFYRMRLRRAER